MNANEAVKLLRSVLLDMVDPISAMRRDLPIGCRLDGYMALSICESPEYYKGLAKKAIAATDYVSKTTEWMPIDTAPKDGTQVLLYGQSGDIKITGGYWSDHRKCLCWIAGGYMQKSHPPTHWMPLPPPPKDE